MPQDTAPQNLAIARVQREDLSVGGSGYDDLPEPEGIARELRGVGGFRDGKGGSRCVGPGSEALDEVDDISWEILYRYHHQTSVVSLHSAGKTNLRICNLPLHLPPPRFPV